MVLPRWLSVAVVLPEKTVSLSLGGGSTVVVVVQVPGDLLHGHEGLALGGAACPSRMVKHVGLLLVSGWSVQRVLCSAVSC